MCNEPKRMSSKADLPSAPSSSSSLQIPEDHETLPFIILPILFHLVVLSYLYSYRKSDGAVLAVALFSREPSCSIISSTTRRAHLLLLSPVSQALFASAPTSFCAVIFAPKHFTKEQQSSWSMSFFALPALGTSLVALVSSSLLQLPLLPLE